MADTLIKLGGNLEDPRNAKPSDWPAVGPTGAAGMAMGQDKLIKQTMNQDGPRHTEDGGDGMPVPTDRSRVISENFKVSVNMGEAGMKPMAVSIPGSVDFVTGQMSPEARMQTY